MARHIPFRVRGRCIDCGHGVEHPHYGTLRCNSCQSGMEALRAKAIVTVRRAIQRGELIPISDCRCVDCEKPASDYDHRDYRRPVAVEPVCRKCNQRRGPAAWQIELSA